MFGEMNSKLQFLILLLVNTPVRFADCVKGSRYILCLFCTILLKCVTHKVERCT